MSATVEVGEPNFPGHRFNCPDRKQAYDKSMSFTVDTPSAKHVLPKPDVLRKNVIEKLEALPDESLAVLHDLVLELELRAAWDHFSSGMAEDWAAGKYEKLDDAIAEARQALRTAGEA